MYTIGKYSILRWFPISFHSLVVLQYKMLKIQDTIDYSTVKDH